VGGDTMRVSVTDGLAIRQNDIAGSPVVVDAHDDDAQVGLRTGIWSSSGRRCGSVPTDRTG